MDKPKFTPGPWVVSEKAGNGNIAINHDVFYVAEATGGLNSTMENANLIAAAPDLYDVLSKLVESDACFYSSAIEGGAPHDIDFSDWYEKAKAALAKARG